MNVCVKLDINLSYDFVVSGFGAEYNSFKHKAHILLNYIVPDLLIEKEKNVAQLVSRSS